MTATGELDLSYGPAARPGGSDGGGLRALPEGFGRLAYLPGRGLRKLVLGTSGNGELGTVPEGLWSMVALEELCLMACGRTELPEGIGQLTGLRKLNLGVNGELTALPEGLWSLAALEELNLMNCRLTALPGRVAAFLRKGVGRKAYPRAGGQLFTWSLTPSGEPLSEVG